MVLIIYVGGIIKDVEVEYLLYGWFWGELEICLVGDVNLFMGWFKKL